MKNTTINLGVIKKVALALNELNERVMYVGGAVVSLYVNDPAADDVRPTKDVDISLEIASLGELEKLREDLTRKGFVQKSEDDVICRFRYEDVKVDVMSTKEVGWAPSDKWFKPGFQNSEEVKIENTRIRIMPLAYFLATKFNAFHDRGSSDARTSHDFEDITYILDNRTDLVEVISTSPADVKKYLKSQFDTIFKSDKLQEAIQGNLYYETRTIRFNLIMEKLKRL
ncbi:MAG: nucleotidyl transferase AbiEii/AbiGii toxin family protein [Bacteroidia bacterium]|nr:nucleotidyl transferase AbiEii/AbiGii toxin family protein [Bacteroidia bacterium]